MYFWNKIKDKNLKTALDTINNVNSIFVSVAFCTMPGATALKELIKKNKIAKDKIEIILGKEFTGLGSYADILQVLIEIGNVYIKEEDYFHPKVYICKHGNKKCTVIFGSANLSGGGLMKNLEFCEIKEGVDPEEMEGFEIASRYRTIKVDDEIITRFRKTDAEYKDINSEINSAKTSQKNIINETLGICKKNPINEAACHFKDHLFLYEDYELFFPRLATTQNDDVINKRKIVQNKLLDILPAIEKHIKERGYDLHKHWDERHITSSIRPIKYNNHYVGWLGVRFGKEKKEIDKVNEGRNREEDNLYGFQKHSCIQYSIFNDGFWVGIFHSVRNDAIDREYLKDMIKDVSFQGKLIEEIKRLKGKGYYWWIGDESFDIDKEAPSSFIKFYNTNDREGVECMLGREYNCDDPNINRTNIVSTINNAIDCLYGMYTLITKRYK